MEMIDLSHCTIEKTDEVKKASLRHYISLGYIYDREKLKNALGVTKSTLSAWLNEIEADDNTTLKEKIVKTRKNNPSLSNREIASYIGCSATIVNKYLKK